MKANELSGLLRQVAALLDQYEGKDLQLVLDDLIKIKSATSQQARREKSQRKEREDGEQAKLEEFALWTKNAELRDVEKILHSETIFSSGENIRIFASLIGLNLGRRQSKDASIQTILSYLDRNRLHRIISGRNGPAPVSERLVPAADESPAKGAQIGDTPDSQQRDHGERGPEQG
ncbi:hypothetical protein RSP673_019300 (plasmid) [Ralstonia solanacearum P673]|uniref:hypothetical protein n=1 Tax=Ralstonia solanacearum TaxID=305 RepID=UPI00202A83AA|nr:hypothetical protein [Ralstonia solanacearum]MCL9849315.1 hypothetical protein [Ralstonia solanacearum]MCL9856036.1 hypothetical protein [Ralstonia solanacearum]MCL9861525.1 hypothetical protein [Ralstonia solanacearum]MCL9865786.1 hypothetical protein [Ralstonia solanacearum]MCL9870556.1 hypothetical protein [Ralstonia solanacearum]